ncbi:MAG: hypothetical protein Q3X03_05810, partial [Eggerthellaceae bacterium]|nr:hypothetical protein [Eggerthellaceae bacterium]
IGADIARLGGVGRAAVHQYDAYFFLKCHDCDYSKAPFSKTAVFARFCSYDIRFKVNGIGGVLRAQCADAVQVRRVCSSCAGSQSALRFVCAEIS